MDQQKIKRINELYKKSKAEGLTDSRTERTEDSASGIHGTCPPESAWTTEQY